MKFCWRISEDNSLSKVVYVVALPTTFPKLGKMMLKHLVCYVWLGVSVGLKTWRTLVVYSSLGLDVREEKIWGCKCSTWHSGFKKGQNIKSQFCSFGPTAFHLAGKKGHMEVVQNCARNIDLKWVATCQQFQKWDFSSYVQNTVTRLVPFSPRVGHWLRKCVLAYFPIELVLLLIWSFVCIFPFSLIGHQA